jgi:hypothetical protein
MHPFMIDLAFRINPTLKAMNTSGPNKAKAEAINAVITAQGVSRKAATTKVARWMAAGSLHLAHGVAMGKALTTAGNMLDKGEAAAFWAMVTATDPASAVTVTPARKPSTTTPTPDASAPVKPLPITTEAAAVIVAQAATKARETMTPEQVGRTDLDAFLKAYGTLVDDLKSGKATLTLAEVTRVATAVKAIGELVAS